MHVGKKYTDELIQNIVIATIGNIIQSIYNWFYMSREAKIRENTH